MSRVTVVCVIVFMAMGSFYRAQSQEVQGWRKDGTWQMQNYGRNHGVLSGPGLPKCNPWVSDECRRLYPSLLKNVSPPQRNN